MKTEKQATTEINNSNWAVKAVKFSRGHDADCMECSLYFEGKRVAIIWDDSYGGGYQYNWIKKGVEDNLDAFAKSFTVKSRYFDKGFTYNADCVVGALVQRFEENKQAKRHCKTKTCFTLKGDEDGSFRYVGIKYGQKAIDWLEKKYSGKVVEILNERFV